MGINELMKASFDLTEDALEMEKQDLTSECNTEDISQEDIDEIVEEIDFSM